MAYYIHDNEIISNIDINYIIDYLKNDCKSIRILHGRIFSKNGDYEINDTLIIENIDSEKDQSKIKYSDGSRNIIINKNHSIVINPYISKNGENTTKDFYFYVNNYKFKVRESKIYKILEDE